MSERHMRHFIHLDDLSRKEITGLFERAARLKAEHAKRKRRLTLAGKVLALVFEKPSLRTRVSFAAAMAQLGGSSLFLSGTETGMGTRESLPDFARVLGSYVDGVVLRTFAHETVERFASHAGCPVINGLSDYDHPCQALADLFTVREAFGRLESRTLVFVGDGNNVARSLATGCAMLELRFVLASPEGYAFDEPFLQRYRERFRGGELEQTAEASEAVTHADVVYTDVWTSMGQEAERAARQQAFADYQVNAKLLSRAPRHALVMHCLPAHRGEEITDDVVDGPRSIIFQQAANRLHVQKALLEWLLGDGHTGKGEKGKTGAGKRRNESRRSRR